MFRNPRDETFRKCKVFADGPAVPDLFGKQRFFQVSGRSGIPFTCISKWSDGRTCSRPNSTDGAEDEATVYRYRMTSLSVVSDSDFAFRFLGFRALKNTRIFSFLLAESPFKNSHDGNGRKSDDSEETKGLLDDDGSFKNRF
ncbi:hypothetical protein TNIN_350291 [Trichonephila inaurata madagascariensis]|uniref:Uncharacterized protein n=1 Tax=Trichonephila inaurata madagascariensis TaxID=2747483 RepID=A0A8X6YR66_9ARAC|nr:hypothetical protein TNIN_350291 [Trichonephila inaurata madagascariensis]